MSTACLLPETHPSCGPSVRLAHSSQVTLWPFTLCQRGAHGASWAWPGPSSGETRCWPVAGWRCVLHCLWVKTGLPHGPSCAKLRNGRQEVPPRFLLALRLWRDPVPGGRNTGRLHPGCRSHCRHFSSWSRRLGVCGERVGPAGVGAISCGSAPATAQGPARHLRVGPRDVPGSSPERGLCTPGLAGGPHSDSVTMNPCAEPPLVALKMGRPKYSMLGVRGAQSCGPGGVCRVAGGGGGSGHTAPSSDHLGVIPWRQHGRGGGQPSGLWVHKKGGHGSPLLPAPPPPLCLLGAGQCSWAEPWSMGAPPSAVLNLRMRSWLTPFHLLT